MHESCVHMPGAGIRWTKTSSKKHVAVEVSGEQESLVDTGGWSILRKAFLIFFNIYYVLEFPEHFQPYKNDWILIVFVDSPQYHHTPTYKAVTRWATYETHTIYNESEFHAELIKNSVIWTWVKYMGEGIARLWLETSGRDLDNSQRFHAETGPRQWLKTRCYELNLLLVAR